MKKEITYSQMFDLQIQANSYLIEEGFLVLDTTKEEKNFKWSDKAATPLSNALKNIIKQIDKLVPDFTDAQNSIVESNSITDSKTTALLFEVDGKTYKQSPEGKKKIREELKKLRTEKINIHIRMTKEIVDLFLYEQFNGIVVAEVKDEFSE